MLDFHCERSTLGGTAGAVEMSPGKEYVSSLGPRQRCRPAYSSQGGWGRWNVQR